MFPDSGKSSAIPGNYLKTAHFSAFLGVLSILNKTFLVFVENCTRACVIQEKDVFEVRDIGFVPFESEKSFEEDDSEKLNQVYSYMIYMKNQLLREGYYFSYDYELSLSRTAFAEGYPPRLKFAWNIHMGKDLLKLQDKSWFLVLLQGSIKSFRYILQGRDA